MPYFSGSTVPCRDGSKSVPIKRVNDDFCDCVDGTDEPGTSACALGMFYCRNRGHKPLTVFSSRVNDGICDCCDGSDEYSGRTQCINTCKEAGASSLHQLRADVQRFKDGAALRQSLVLKAQTDVVKWQQEAAQLAIDIEGAEQRERDLLAQKEAIEKAEAEERAWREKLEKEQEALDQAHKDAEAAAAAAAAPAGEEAATGEETEGETEEGAEAKGETGGEGYEEAPAEPSEVEYLNPVARQFASLEDDMELEEALASSLIKRAEAEQGKQEEQAVEAEAPSSPEPANLAGSEEDLSGLSADEIGQRVMSRWTGGSITDMGSDSGGSEGSILEPDVPGALSHHSETFGDEEDDDDLVHEDDEQYQRGRLEPEYDEDEEEEEEADDGHPSSPGDDDFESAPEDIGSPPPAAASPVRSWLARALQWPRNVCFRLLGMKVPPPPQPFEKSEAEKVKREHREAASELQRLRRRKEELEGNLKQDYGPNGVFTSLVGQCHSLKMSQYEYKVCPFGDAIQVEGHVRTRLGSWNGFNDDYTKMQFQEGDRCWNGPARSIAVRLECGLSTEIISVEEPSRCEYAAVMTSPTACTEERAQDLEKELQAKLQEINDDHDEL
eukprot:TRINITY_DN213_c0_g1_i1.p1 TRINITY_DN213_c0_g1~~TRINITY_DN213_c0_g1_i1.p1  ORF type:complete len:687 (+),score=192.78 TRINITY_DN213_c0_g1_i1:227-2062(+)